MRFCIVTPFFPSKDKSGGGVGTHYYDLVRYIAPFCEEVILLFVSESPMDDEIRERLPSNVRIEYIQDDYARIPGNPYSLPTKIRKRLSRFILNFKIAFRLLSIDRKSSIDVVETTNYLYLCLLYTFLPDRKPLITRFSSSTGQLRLYGNWRNPKWNLIEQLEIWMFKRSDVKLTHTKQHGKLISNHVDVPLHKISIIPHGTSITEDVERATTHNQKEEFIVLFVGRLELRKGIFTLLDAVPRLVQDCPNIHIRIAGEDPENVRDHIFLENMSEFSSQVSFLGEISHAQKIKEYENCDVFAAPSLYESFGLIYVEAMSFGKPVIGCRAGGAIEVISDREVGFLIEPDSTEQLIESIVALANDENLRKRMGIAAKERVENLFTASTMARNSYEALSVVKSDWNLGV